MRCNFSFHSEKRIGLAMSYGVTNPFNSGCVNALRSFQDAFNGQVLI